ncbi:MAG: hypothetical protein M1819_001255 [Sarea resinae]|nr:MAG: hypothetical protein M1819_001255 [Sarea resinae]
MVFKMSFPSALRALRPACQTCKPFIPRFQTSVTSIRSASNGSPSPDDKSKAKVASTEESDGKAPTSKQHKTMAQLDEELRQKLEGRSGDGGAAGIELEDGQPVSMKRSVKNNMFRYI